MKKVTLIVAKTKPEKVLQKDFDAAKKLEKAQGPMVLNHATAIQNVALSKGLYEIKPEEKPIDVNLTGMKEPEQMTADEFVAELVYWGKKPTKKQMKRTDLIKMIKGLRKAAADAIEDDLSEDIILE